MLYMNVYFLIGDNFPGLATLLVDVVAWFLLHGLNRSYVDIVEYLYSKLNPWYRNQINML